MLFPLDTIAAILFVFASIEFGSPATGSLQDAALLMGITLVLVVCTSTLLCQGACLYLRRSSATGLTRHRVAHGIDLSLRFLIVTTFYLVTVNSGCPQLLGKALENIDSFGVLARMAALVPYILFCLGSWLAYYPLHRLTAADHWPLGRFLLHRFQYSFFILGLVIPSAFLFGLFETYQSFLPGFLLDPRVEILFLLPTLLLACLFPLFLRYFWECAPLENGPLRQRLDALQKKAGVPFSQVFVWNIGGGRILNAAAVGFVPPFRYLFLSKALLERMDPDEIDAVVCHEMGHIKHHHLLYYLVFTLAVMGAFSRGIQMMAVQDPMEQTLWLLGGMVIHIRIFFGFFSRRFERQADLTALEIMATPRPLIEGLERIGLYAGNIRNAPSWHHMSIAERVLFLKQAHRHPELIEQHHHAVRALLLFASLLACGLLFYTYAPAYRSHGVRRPAPRFHPRPEETLRQHRRRVKTLIPPAPQP